MNIKPLWPEKVTTESIEDLESKLGQKLPDQYRLFIFQHNGGMPGKNLFQINQAQGKMRAEIFYGITNNKCYDIFSNAAAIYKEVPDCVIPIAEDAGGNKICLGICEEYIIDLLF